MNRGRKNLRNKFPFKDNERVENVLQPVSHIIQDKIQPPKSRMIQRLHKYKTNRQRFRNDLQAKDKIRIENDKRAKINMRFNKEDSFSKMPSVKDTLNLFKDKDFISLVEELEIEKENLEAPQVTDKMFQQITMMF